MSETPLVSIIIPTYNRSDYLRRALNSAINQTYGNIEIMVVDDCSDLNLDPLKKEFDSVRFLRNEENKGACFSRNRGLKLAKGEYINFLDDDDELFPDKISLQLKKFQTSEVENLGFVTAHAEDKRSGKVIIKENRVRGNMYKPLLNGYAISGIETLLIKKECLVTVDGFDERLQSSQEYDLMIRLAEKYNVDYLDKVCSRENRSRDQISLNFDKKIQGAKFLFNKHDDRYRSLGVFFWLKMRLKLRVLLMRFWIGKTFGERAYRLVGG